MRLMHAKHLLRNQLNERNLKVSENIRIRMGRKDYRVDFYLQEQNIGIITLDWNRTIPVSKILQLERVKEALKLKKLILVCNSISDNAKEFLAYRNQINIQVVHSAEIEKEQKKIDDLFN